MNEYGLNDDSTTGPQHDIRQPLLSAKLRQLAPVAAICLVLLGAIVAFMMAIAEPPRPSDKSAAPTPKPAAPIPAQTLDLVEFYGVPASRFVNGRFPWGEVPKGKKTFGNVPLDIGGAFSLWGAVNAKMGMNFRKEYANIPVNRKIETLYVYHCTFFTSPEGSPVYRLTMHYEDGTTSETTIRYGTHVLDWYQRPEQPVTDLSDSKLQIVWRGDPADTTPNPPDKLRFCITSIPSVKPSLYVQSISLASSMGNSAGCILAMTTGPADLLKPDVEANSPRE